MRVILKRIFCMTACSAAVMLFAAGAAGCAQTADTPKILKFAFRSSDNSFLPADAAGIIDQTARLITVRLPRNVYGDDADRSSLSASIVYGAGTTLVSSSASDYSESPVTLTVAASGSTVSYLVYVEQAHETAPAGSLLFTEYYSGLAYSFKGANNQYIEITNVSSSAVDLAGVELNRHSWNKGVRGKSHDQSVPLAGMLPAGASVVVYSARTKFAFTGQTLSDADLNSIISFSGQDGLTLTSGGTVLDALGPGDGIGTGWTWGEAKLMQRKSGVTGYTGWKESEWISTAATNCSDDAANAGAVTSTVSPDAKDITYFALEGLASIVYGVIDTSARTVDLSVKESLGTVFKPTVSTNGKDVRLEGSKKIISGSTEIDFSGASETNPLKLYVFDAEGSSAVYDVVFTPIAETVYTRANYDFDGGIADLLARIETAGSAGVTCNETVTGVLTCRDVYGYKTAQKCFFLQDKNAGLYFYVPDNAESALPAAAVVGNKITVHVNAAKTYYDMPEVTEISGCRIADSGIRSIYYETGRYSEPGCLGRVFEYTGTVASGMDSNMVGIFSASEELYFHGTSSLKAKTAAGTYGRFFGPAAYSYSKYRIEITDENQIKEK